MDALDVEGDDAGAAVGRRPVDGDPVELRETLDRVTDEILLVLLDRIQADLGDVVDRGAHPVGLDERGRAGLELVREVVPGRLLDRDLADHLAAHLERLHALEQLAASEERARARRAAELVRSEAEEVDAERLHVDAAVRDGLRGVDDHDRALLVGPGGEPVDRVDRAERVGDEVRGDDLDPACLRDLVEPVEAQLAGVFDPDHAELGAGALRDLLPGDEIRVVLELGDDGDVAGAEVVQSPGIGHEVERLGDVPREDHFLQRGGVDQRPHLLARPFVAGGRALGEVVDAAVHVCVRRLVELAHRVQHLPRFLRARGRVQVGQRLPVDGVLEDRKIPSHGVRIELRACGHGHTAIVPRRRAMKVLAPSTDCFGHPAAGLGLRRRWRLEPGQIGRGQGVHRSRLQPVPHPFRGQGDGSGRPEPRPAQARCGHGRPPGARWWQRHALVREPALEDADPAGGRVRGRRGTRGGEGPGLQARQDDARGLRRQVGLRLLPAGVREPRVQRRRPDEGAEHAGDGQRDRPRRSEPTATRSSTRSGTRRSPSTTTTPARRSPTAR